MFFILRHPGVFIARGKEDALVTKNLVPGSEVYGEKRISVEVCIRFTLISVEVNYFRKTYIFKMMIVVPLILTYS